MAQPQLIQIALEGGGHNAIGVDQEGGVWRGRIQRATSGEEFIVWKRIRSEFLGGLNSRRRASDDATRTKGLAARRVLPARLGCNRPRRVRVGAAGVRR